MAVQSIGTNLEVGMTILARREADIVVAIGSGAKQSKTKLSGEWREDLESNRGIYSINNLTGKKYFNFFYFYMYFGVTKNVRL